MTDETAVAEQEPAAADVDAEAQAKADARAEFQNHPHTRLSAIINELSGSRGDLHDRIGALERNLQRMAQLLIGQHEAPEPPEE